MMAGLFNTPQEVQAAQMAQLRQQGSQPNPLQGGLFALGDALGGAGIRGLGGSTPNPAVQQATQMQQIMKGIDFKDPNSIMQGANALNDNGMQPQAFKLLSLLPKDKEQKAFVVSEGVEELGVGDAKGQYFVQRYSDGSMKKVYQLTDSGGQTESGSTFKLSPKLSAEVVIREPQQKTLIAKLINTPIFKTRFPTGSTDDPEAFREMVSLYEDTANKLKQGYRTSLLGKYSRGEIDDAQLEVLSARPDTYFLDAAYQQFSRAGLEENVDVGYGNLGADVSISPDKITTDPNVLAAQITRDDELEKLRSEIPDLPGTDDPSKFDGAFNPRHIPVNKRMHGKDAPFDAMDIVSELRGGTSPDQLREKLEAVHPMSDATFDQHERFWNALASKRPETQEFIAAYLADTDPQARLSLLQRERAARLDAGDLQGAVALRTIKKYLDMFDDTPTSKVRDYSQSIRY